MLATGSLGLAILLLVLAHTSIAQEAITAYYRVQGPYLVIEYAPQHDEPAKRAHSMSRDPTNDYGRPAVTP